MQAGKSLSSARESAEGSVLCLHVPHAHPSSVTPRFEVSEILFLLLVVEGGRSQNLGLLRGPPKACAWPE